MIGQFLVISENAPIGRHPRLGLHLVRPALFLGNACRATGEQHDCEECAGTIPFASPTEY
jgi:hypothetical protein